MIKSEWTTAIRKAETPEDFYRAIPTDLRENIEMRQWLHSTLEKDFGFQQVFKAMVFEEPKIFFNSVAWTYNPNMPPGSRNWPFILWFKQEGAVDTLQSGIINRHDCGINKSREEGATEIICKLFACHCLVVPDSSFIVGSRTEDLVDGTGDPSTLFAKIRYTFNCLPVWWKKELDGELEDIFCHIKIKNTNSSIDGATTNENFKAGGRATALLLDEFGRVPARVAESIEGSIHDISRCIIYSSTHWLGANHTFNVRLLNKATKVTKLMWHDNPFKNSGLYKSPDYDQIEILDIDYYRELCPEVFNHIESGESFKLSEFEQTCLTLDEETQEKLKDIRFIADGNPRIPYRAPWHDIEEEKRATNKRDFWCNIWATPLGSTDSVFDPDILLECKSKLSSDPLIFGEVVFETDSEGYVLEPKFIPNFKQNRLKWWGSIKDGRPDQAHNYIIGCDPSHGTGASNSVAQIMDTNTGEQVGEWVCPNTTPEDFADQVVALGRWAGGESTTAYLIWENNGGHGINFGKRIQWQGYTFFYSQRKEKAKYPKPEQDTAGWHSNREAKETLCGELGIAVAQSLSGKRSYKYFIPRSYDLIDEMSDYMFSEGGEIVASKRADLSSGARERHGDRVIAAGLCVLGLKYQPAAAMEFKREAKPGTFMHRVQQERERREMERRTQRKFLF